jgi:hypothetical protein
MERYDDENVVQVYQEENKGHQSLSFTVSNGVGLVELGTRDIELMEEEPDHSRKHLRKLK